MNLRRTLLSLPFLIPASLALPRAAFAQSQLEASVEDASAEFLRLYAEMSKPEQTAETRLALWKQQYELKGVPQSDAAFAAAWPRYASALERIKAGFEGIKPGPVQVLSRMAGAARFTQPLKLVMLSYVGSFDQPARIINRGEELVLALPLELDPQLLAAQAAHALAELVLPKTNYAASRAKNLAERIALDGLGLHLIRHGMDTSDDALVWKPYGDVLASSASKLAEMARSTKPLLSDTKPETIARMTTGTGTAGLQRQSQILGYAVVKTWLTRGMSFGEILETKPAELVRTMGIRFDTLGK
jgi:hypothetical protein